MASCLSEKECVITLSESVSDEGFDELEQLKEGGCKWFWCFIKLEGCWVKVFGQLSEVEMA